MTFDSKRAEYGKEHLYLVEIDLEFCNLTSGIAPCTATETGDDKCFNTRQTTNDLPNFDPILKTYRFCESRSPHPVGIDAIPSLESVRIAPATIDITGGLGVRSSASIRFRDHPHSDIDIDKYVDERTWIASDRGTFWTKLRARNPGYQFRALRVLSGYLENGVFDEGNFITRHYVIDRLDVTGGMATITAKDPLKLASALKAKAPFTSTGQLSADLTAGVTSATLTPAGVGNSEYDASGKVLIDAEVSSFTRVADVLTLTRAQNNTDDVDHNADATVQQCLSFNDQVNVIVEDLLTTFAGIDASFIPTSEWQSEVDTFLSGLLDGIIVKPRDVNKILKELSEAMPHYLYWDERLQQITLTALKAPPEAANVLNMDENIVAESFATRDKPEMRRATVLVNFGQFDPTKQLDELGNYDQSYVRVDTDSIAKFQSNNFREINTRWISSNNKGAALQLAALYGRRFADTPREVTFKLEAKDAEVWAGQTRSINHRDIVDGTGVPVDTIFQILSSGEAALYEYKALEYVYGPALPEDEGGGDPDVDIILLSIDQNNINLRTIYDTLFPAPDASTQAKFIVEGGVVLGSDDNTSFAIDTGSWPAGALVTLALKSSAVAAGKGGDGDVAPADTAGIDGGPCLILNNDLTLDNNGIIGGGGGAGGWSFTILAVARSGGGGAGRDVGLRGFVNGALPPDASDGTTLTGGIGASTPASLRGGAGGDLGDDGEDGVGGTTTQTGGPAGDAIDKNGFTLTFTMAGDIRGDIIA